MVTTYRKANRLLLLLLAASAVLSLLLPVRRATAMETPILQLLAMIPDTPENRSEISYLDMEALVSGRPGAVRPKTVEEWQQGKDEAAGLYRAALLGVSTGDADLLRIWQMGGEIRQTVGIDPFAVTQQIRFGKPPAHAVIYRGQFDTAAIDAALKKQTFVPQPSLDSFLLWCSPDGCEAGNKLNVNAIQRANPFGGTLGRLQPIAASSEFVFSSPGDSLVKAIATTSAGKTPNLAAVPDYQALIGAISASGSLAQLYLIDPAMLSATPVSGSAGPLPAYTVLGFAHVIEASQYHALVALVYDTNDNARTAGDTIAARIAQYQSLRTRKRFTDMIKDRNGTLAEPRLVADSATGKVVLLLDFSAPVESDKPDRDGRFVSSGLLFRLLIEMVQSRDTNWLALGSGS